jgi:transcription factor Dp-1
VELCCQFSLASHSQKKKKKKKKRKKGGDFDFALCVFFFNDKKMSAVPSMRTAPSPMAPLQQHEMQEQDSLEAQRQEGAGHQSSSLSSTSATSRTTTTSRTTKIGAATTKTPRGQQGLRHFSKLVCDKVKEAGTTTHSEVADRLVSELLENASENPRKEKNIRRRIYDALNVLQAAGVLAKSNKSITWVGLPSGEDRNRELSRVRLLRERVELQQAVRAKQDQLGELLQQVMVYNNLIQRNSARNVPTRPRIGLNGRLRLPFIVVDTPRDTTIQVSMTDDRTQYIFEFTQPFEIHDDSEVLGRIADSGSMSPHVIHNFDDDDIDEIDTYDANGIAHLMNATGLSQE